jgi:2,3-dihydro-2,3-dihydroxybenzoate dehydrogenase
MEQDSDGQLDGQFDGQVAIVTGAAQGIGAAVTRALADRGAIVAAVDVKPREGDDGGQRVENFVTDVRDSAAVDTLVKRVEYDLGPIATLVNVAGVLRTGPIVELTDEDWAAVFAVNTTGVFNFSRAVGRRMMERRGGAIVTVGSNAAAVPRMHMAAYAASKAATAQFTKCLGLELARYGVRCNVVAPGSTETPMQRAMWTDAAGARAVIAGSAELFKVGIPLARLAQPSDIADAVVFLASEQARHITMQVLCVDGGAALGC